LLKWTLLFCFLPLAGERVSQELLVRLMTPLTTTSKAGERFEGVVTGCAYADCLVMLPAGSTIHGFVRQVLPVGFGVRRERASMALEFTGCRLPNGAELLCHSELLSLDNAREAVTKGNRIHGILAADHPHSLLSGVWFRPSTALFTRSLSGLNGAGRMLYSGIAPHPLFASAILITRMAVLRLPEPELHIPPGTDMILLVSGEAPERRNEIEPIPERDSLAEWLENAPVRVAMPDGTTAADIINFAFRGSNVDLTLAFLGAGWTTADALNGRTFVRAYRAFTEMRPYPTAPVSPLRYEGRLPDLVFQKSFNTMAKRHHVRLWKVDSPAGPVWLAAATHDVGIAFDWKRLTLTHRIDREIDRERDRVLADLSFAGCVNSSTTAPRPDLARNNAKLATDGALHIAETKTCSKPVSAPPAFAAAKKPRLGKVVLRRAILEARHYVIRGNAYYWTFRGLRSRTMQGFFVRAGIVAAK